MFFKKHQYHVLEADITKTFIVCELAETIINYYYLINNQ